MKYWEIDNKSCEDGLRYQKVKPFSSIVDASNLINDHCRTYSKEKSNSLVVKECGGMPLSPRELIPSTFIDFSTQKVTNTNLSQNNNKSQPQKIDNIKLSLNNIPCVLNSSKMKNRN